MSKLFLGEDELKIDSAGGEDDSDEAVQENVLVTIQRISSTSPLHGEDTHNYQICNIHPIFYEIFILILSSI